MSLCSDLRARSLGRLGAALLLSISSQLSAQPCSVPGSHGSIQSAIDDASCTAIALGATSFGEILSISRSLSLDGPAGGGAVLEGTLSIDGAGTEVQVAHLTLNDGCGGEPLRVLGGARLEADGLVVAESPDLSCADALFRDGFESGSASAWSDAIP